MKNFPHTIHSEQGASTLQTIALTAIVLIFITGALTVIWNRGDEFDVAVDRVGDNQVALWRDGGNIPPPVTGPTYEINFGEGRENDASGGSENSQDTPEEEREECDTGFFGGLWNGVKDMAAGLWALKDLIWDMITDWEKAKEQLGAAAEQLKVLLDAVIALIKNPLSLDNFKKVVGEVFPEIVDALDRDCYGEAAGLITFEVLSSGLAVGKISKSSKLFDKLTPEQRKRLDGQNDNDGNGVPNRPCALASGNSFSHDTLVTTASGRVPISELSVGHQVLAFNEATGKVGTYPIVATMMHLDPKIVLLTIDGELIETTPEHPFYVMESAPWRVEGESAGRWVMAENLRAGDKIYKRDGSTGDLTKNEVVPLERWMYNLTVAEAHTFFVGEGQWLVHNSDCFSIIKWKGFSKGKLAEHYQKHVIDQGEFGNISQAEYLRRAKDFAAETSDNFKVHIVNNIVIKYDPSTGRVIIGNKNAREIRTFYIDDGRSPDPFQAAIDYAEELSSG